MSYHFIQLVIHCYYRNVFWNSNCHDLASGISFKLAPVSFDILPLFWVPSSLHSGATDVPGLSALSPRRPMLSEKSDRQPPWPLACGPQAEPSSCGPGRENSAADQPLPVMAGSPSEGAVLCQVTGVRVGEITGLSRETDGVAGLARRRQTDRLGQP